MSQCHTVHWLCQSSIPLDSSRSAIYSTHRLSTKNAIKTHSISAGRLPSSRAIESASARPVSLPRYFLASALPINANDFAGRVSAPMYGSRVIRRERAPTLPGSDFWPAAVPFCMPRIPAGWRRQIILQLEVILRN